MRRAHSTGGGKLNRRGISRIDSGSQHLWWVRLFWKGEQGERRYPLVQRSFSDRTWGGRDQALEAAVEWRDRQLQIWAGLIQRKKRSHGSDRAEAVAMARRAG